MSRLAGFILLAAVLLPSLMKAQITFSFDQTQGVSLSLKEKMDRNISALLTEINQAGMSGKSLNLSNVDMEEEAKRRLIALWSDTKFICTSTINHSLCLKDYQGFQARDIPIVMKYMDETGNQTTNRELTISLNKSGVITGVRLAWEFQQSKESILKASSKVTDSRERYEILKWIEDFRCYYNERNIKALDQIYSDDALIITGSIVMSQGKRSDFHKYLENNTSYKVQSKSEYISKLSSIFSSGRKIRVEFDSIEIKRHGSRPHIYGVTLRQKWQSGSYRDEGWLFLLWDFNNPDYPQIYVRTWQPLNIRKDERPNVYSFPYSN